MRVERGVSSEMIGGAAMWTTPVPDETWLRRHTQEWVEHGLVTPEQAEAVVRFEADEGAVTPVETDVRAGAGLSLLAESAAYVGSVLALLAGAFVMAESWENLPVVVRVVVGVIVAVVGLVGGQTVARLGDAGSLRLAGFLRAVGAAGAAFAVGVVTFEADVPDWAAALAIGATLLAVGGPLWRNLDRPLQMLTTMAGGGAVLMAVGLVVEPPAWAVGATVWVVGALLGTAGLTERLRPPVYVACLGAVAMVVGATGAFDLFGEGGVFAVVATAALIVVAGLSEHSVPVLVIGVLALLQSTVQMLATFVRGPVALLALLVVGLTTVVVVLVRARHTPPAAPT